MLQDKIQIFNFLSSERLPTTVVDKVFQNLLEKYEINALTLQSEDFAVYSNKLSSETEVKSIFSYLQKGTKSDYLPNIDLSINKDCFPNTDVISKHQSIEDAVKSLLLSELTEKELAEKLFYIFKQKAWSLKASKGQDYLSEFEYLKSKTAFSVCLHHAQNEANPFLLFCADISGIQSFIYDIHSKKASKSLKGRSFYLQLLLDSLLERYITATETTICNVIYSSGGKFFMLLPNTDNVKKALNQLEIEITKELYEEHTDTLSIVSGYVPFTILEDYEISSPILDAEGNDIDNLRQLWKVTSLVTSKKKQTKLQSLFANNFNLFFDGGLDMEFGARGFEPCEVTGRPTNNRSREGEFLLPQVMVQTELGQDLRDANFINLNYNNKGIRPLPNADLYELHGQKRGEKSFIINPIIGTQGTPFVFYGGNKQALNDEGLVKTFEQLTTPDSKDKNFNKLGVLRMDVDNLGHIFTGARSDKMENLSFATYSTLSSALDWFFSGYLNTLRNTEGYKDFVNIIYAGGDDLFAVGRWDKLIDFAIDVRKEFRAYIGNDDRITLSAGIAVVNNKFPIAKAADMAGDAIDEAKTHKRHIKNNEPDKDAFHLFGLSVSWANGDNDEMSFVRALADVFNEYDLNRAFFYKLYQYKTLKNDKKEIRMDWYWQSAYHISRYIERLKASETEKKELLKAVQKAIVSTEFTFKKIHLKSSGLGIGRMLDLICLAGQLADYYKR